MHDSNRRVYTWKCRLQHIVFMRGGVRRYRGDIDRYRGVNGHSGVYGCRQEGSYAINFTAIIKLMSRTQLSTVSAQGLGGWPGWRHAASPGASAELNVENML